jgi:hypothetical protein
MLVGRCVRSTVTFATMTGCRAVSVLTDLTAISLTANAKSVVSAKGADLGALITLAKEHTTELTTVLKQIVAVHPSGGGDAANYAALNTIIGELA